MNQATAQMIANDLESSCIAVIAGSGDLPKRVTEKLDALKRPYVVLSVEGFGPVEYESFKLGEFGKALAFLKCHNVAQIVFCGAVKRPSLLSLRLDKTGKKWLKELGVKAFLGDDALLRGIKKILSNEGIELISPQSILQTLLTPKGILTKSKPTERDLEDIARGVFVLNALSKADVGQAVVVQEGIVLGIEAKEGTRELLNRCRDLKLSPKGGVLVKTAKLDQDRSLDLPTIGKNTILEATEAGLSGIAIGGLDSQIIDFDETINLANEHGLFILGL